MIAALQRFLQYFHSLCCSNQLLKSVSACPMPGNDMSPDHDQTSLQLIAFPSIDSSLPLTAVMLGLIEHQSSTCKRALGVWVSAD